MDDSTWKASIRGWTPWLRRHGESLALTLAFFALTALRILYALHHQVDSDEPQHLHVVWGWTQGLVQYRDVFDNHAPLFHLLIAPFAALIGERANVLTYARLLMLPFVAVSIWATCRIGRSLWSERIGLWAGAVAGFVPSFLLASTEFRADDLWMACWLSALAVLLDSRLTPRRGFLAGLLLGATMAASLKSVLLILALGAAYGTVRVFDRRSGDRWAPPTQRPAVAALVLGFLVLPVLLMVAFWRMHALGALVYCTVRHNIAPGLGLWHSAPQRLLILPVALVILTTLGWASYRRDPRSRAQRLRVVLLLATGIYLALLESIWPLITEEDFLPWIPMVVLLAVAGMQHGLNRVARQFGPGRIARWRTAAGAAALGACLVGATFRESAWREPDPGERQLLAAVLEETRPGEPVMDLKGETVFRPRPYYYVLEGVTKWRLQSGLLPDSIASEVVGKRTHFAVPDNRFFPPAARRFLNAHFVSVGPLRVLGTDLGDQRASARSPRLFDVSYAERFAVVADGKGAGGDLDGVRYRNPVLLHPGLHSYLPLEGERHVAVLWVGALERGLVAEPETRE